MLPDPVRLAVGTLTALPVPPPGRLDRRTAGTAMLLAPLVGLLLGASAGLLGLALLLAGLAALPTAVLTVGALALATRGLHLDGLADTADGLAAGYDRDRALAVMRRGDVGPAGAATLVLVLLSQVAALGAGLDAASPVRFAAAVCLGVLAGRCALPLACRRGVPPARPSGLGATVAGTVPRPLAWALPLAAAAVAGGLGAAAGWPWWRGPLAVALAAVVTLLVLAHATRRLGGITGDVLGACVELATTAALLALAG